MLEISIKRLNLFVTIFLFVGIFSVTAQDMIMPQDQYTRLDYLNETITDTDKLIFSISADPTGFLLLGPSITIEFSKRWFNTQIYSNFPSLGLLINTDNFSFGIGASFNYFMHIRTGGFYLGGLLGYKYGAYRIFGWFNPNDGDWYTEKYETNYQWKDRRNGSSFTIALNAGYKYVLSSGIYFRIGGIIGADFGFDTNFLARPDISFGYNF
ncbi:MAG: hypothetical protein FWD22_06295 [Treponema sp.]|nr:hypothetical protein [Treponema sp.]